MSSSPLLANFNLRKDRRSESLCEGRTAISRMIELRRYSIEYLSLNLPVSHSAWRYLKAYILAFKCYTCYDARGCVYILVDMTLIPMREGDMYWPGVYKASNTSLRWLVVLFDFEEASHIQVWLWWSYLALPTISTKSQSSEMILISWI